MGNLLVYQGCPRCRVNHCPHAYRPARRGLTREQIIAGVMISTIVAVLVGGKPVGEAVAPAVDAIREAVIPDRPPAPQPVAWSAAAKAEIPGPYQVLYAEAAETCPALSPFLLAGVGRVESSHGKSRAPGVRSGVNRHGCCAGPMQFNITNGPPSTWDSFSEPGQSPYKSEHAIPAAARKLCANGLEPTPDNRQWEGVLDADPCPDVRGTPESHRALRRYNNACWYVRGVIHHGLRYAHEGRGVT